MRVVKELDQRKQEILEAAIKIFVQKGYDKTSISDIADEIGISQGLCYRYFASKEEIYDEAISMYAEYIAQQNMGRFLATGKSLKEHIEMLCEDMEKYKEVEKGQAELYELFHKEGNKKIHDLLCLKIADKLIPSVTRLLEEAVERGEIALSDPYAMAVFVAYGQVGILNNDRISPQDKMVRIKQFLLQLL